MELHVGLGGRTAWGVAAVGASAAIIFDIVVIIAIHIGMLLPELKVVVVGVAEIVTVVHVRKSIE